MQQGRVHSRVRETIRHDEPPVPADHLAALTLPNRIVIAPMCQYSAENGDATDWHMVHLGSLALSGAGLLILEATAVEAEGRITAGDLGLYSESNERALARVLGTIRKHSPIPVGVAAVACRAQGLQPSAVAGRRAGSGGAGRLADQRALRRGVPTGR